MLTSPLAAGAFVVCTGTYTLTAEDINNLLRASRVTVDAKDQYGYEVEASADETVTLEQVSKTSQCFNISTDSLILLCSGYALSGVPFQTLKN